MTVKVFGTATELGAEASAGRDWLVALHPDNRARVEAAWRDGYECH